MRGITPKLFSLFVAFTMALGMVGQVTQPAVAAPSELFISEYIEGSSNNKAIEIYNGTGSAIDLAAGGYKLQVYFNGSSTATLTINLTGTVANGDVYVVAHASANATILGQADQTSSASWYNGDDAVVLVKGTTNIDVIGQIGLDPGTQWGTDLTSTADNTLRRKGTIQAGDPNGSDSFDPSIEWDGYAVDTVDGLGSHTLTVLTPVINEFSASTVGTDVEYVEIYGTPFEDYSAYTVLSIEGDATSQGTVDRIISLGTTDANGLYLVSLTAGALENGTMTLLLVKDFSGSLNADLDTNNDGTFDVTPWTALVDSVGVNDGGAGDIVYGIPSLGVAYDGQPYAPGGASRIPDGYDTDAASDWVRNDFDLAGIPGYTGTPVNGEAYNTPGVFNQIIIIDLAPTVSSTYPVDGATDFPMNGNVLVSFSEPVDVSSGGISISCATSGSVLVGVTWNASHSAITLDPTTDLVPLETCTVSVTASAISDRDAPIDYMATDYTFGFTVAPDPCTLSYTPIHTIQGSSDIIALTGTQTTMGVVVADFEGTSPNLRGFFIQELDANQDGDPATSEGIFVFEGSNADTVSLGDLVRVTGTASDYFGQSQISVGMPLVCGTGYSVTPTAVTLPVADAAYLERYEGMLVTFPQQLFVTENYYLGRFGQVTLSSGSRLDQPTAVADPGAAALAVDAANRLNKIIVDDATNDQNPDPILFGRGGNPLSASNTLRGGDSITGLTGVLTYTWSGDATSDTAYRVRPITSMAGYYNFAATNPRPTAAPEVGGSAKIVGMNLLNYFNTFDGADDKVDNCTFGVGGAAADCRGADTSDEFDRQWPKTVAAITTLDADVFGVVEVENDGYGPDSAIQDLVNKLNAVAGPGTYAFIDVDSNTGIVNALGTDAIRNALIYKPANVTPVGTTAVLNSVEFVNGGDAVARNRVSLLQAFEDNSTGAVFLVNVNHLKSKGTPCTIADAGDGQGECNIVRLNGVNALMAWFATDPTGTGDPDIVMLGDLNSYAMEDPIKALEAGGFINAASAFMGDAAYSYVFNENVGALDYAMVSSSFYAQMSGADEWHINADEPVVLDYNTNFISPAQIISLYSPGFYRMADHDPVVVGFSPDGTYPTAAMTDPPNGTVLTNVEIDQLTVAFSRDVMHDGGEFAADNPANYLLVERGNNNLFDTTTCGEGLQTDDVQITVDSVEYDPATFVAVLGVNGGTPLPRGTYRLFVCGTSSIRDLVGNVLNGGLYDSISDFSVLFPVDAAAVTELPATGFAPDRVTELPAQTVDYADLGSLWLEIPRLNSKASIVGVPQTGNSWDVSWLGSQAGWLEGSAYPTALGNSVLTGHVWDALNRPGAFYGLGTLVYGDRVIVHSGGKTYTYEVRQVMRVSASNVSAVLQHQQDAWLTLVTCQGWNAEADQYDYRTLVRAVLVDVR
jgi:LPXTG-site transpeptidase (sortase) family protein